MTHMAVFVFIMKMTVAVFLPAETLLQNRAKIVQSISHGYPRIASAIVVSVVIYSMYECHKTVAFPG
ncbi:hypothetical protein RBA71_14820 [Brenneria goodwinii]|uniref:hypothetical protein n=2 Tax=Brenneria goodwinii TaxID=1109412 RepID=UPI000EF221A9|nr:hypothetical protein [Brenneria goodwinii]MCG8164862.1 hypothetical protein [Brenneria goodwinii]RLM26110.1 hypothetical protein BIY28_00495 [Brenneria goodwinii]